MKKIVIILLLLPILSFSDIGILQKIVDGDTLYFYSKGYKVKCRIAYIDTPESKRNKRAKKFARKCPNVTLGTIVKAGKLATKHAKQLVQVGKKYRFDVVDRDRYGRSICIVHLPGQYTYNELMVLDGYAVPYWYYLPKRLKRKFFILQREAKSNRVGLWDRYRKVMQCLGD